MAVIRAATKNRVSGKEAATAPRCAEISFVSLMLTARVAYGGLLLVAVLTLLPSQMRDMLAALTDSHRPGAIAAFPVSMAVLGFCCWYWARAAISARFNLPDSKLAWRSIVREGEAGTRPFIYPAALYLVPQAPIPIAGLIGLGMAAASNAFGLGAATFLLLLLEWVLIVNRHDIHRFLHDIFIPQAPFGRQRLPPETPQLACSENLLEVWRRMPFRARMLLERAPSGIYFSAALLMVSLAVFALAAGISFFPASSFASHRNLIWTAFSGPTPALLGVALMVGPMTMIVFVADGYKPCLRFRGAPIGLRRPPVMLLILALSLSAPYWVDLHGVRKIPGKLPARPALDVAYRQWQAACGKQARPVVVAISGGAARSALWGASVMARLDLAIAGFSPPRPAAIFAISSVSGGSLGAASYLSVRARQGGESPCAVDRTMMVSYGAFARDGLSADAIGPLLAGFVLSDIPRALIGAVPAALGADLRGGDRAAAIERAFENNAYRAARDTGVTAVPLDAPYLSLMSRPGAPLWIANATDRDNGRRVLATPFQFDTQDPGAPFSGTIDMLSVAGADMPISTVVNATARFPFIEPPGDIATEDAHNTVAVIDGGYYDDSGLETAMNLTDWLRRQGADPILVAVSGNGESQGTSGISSEDNANEILRCDAPNPPNLAQGPPSAELLAPLIGVYEARAAHVDMLLRRARAAYCGAGHQSFFQFYLGALGRDSVPLNWVLSKRMADHVWRSSGVEPVPPFLRDQVIDGNITEGDKFAAALGVRGSK